MTSTRHPDRVYRRDRSAVGRPRQGAVSRLMRVPALVLLLGLSPLPSLGQSRTLEPSLLHLRSGADREWTSFEPEADGPDWTHRFTGAPNATDVTLCLRQQDVKQGWRVLLNGEPLGTLSRDENDIRLCLPVPQGLLADQNVLRIEPTSRTVASDDIRVGEVTLHARPMATWLTEAWVDVSVVDEVSGTALPSRLTIVDATGAFMTTGTTPAPHLAVRPGVVYTATGTARIGLPAGRYTVYAGRGFEYSLAKVELTLAPGESADRRLALRREVPMPGYVASDTHVHTFTHSGHGDATLDERMVTLAGEGIELPIATDHNVHIDYDPPAREVGVRAHFTPIAGNEFTTPSGHFNVFPVRPDDAAPDATSPDWAVSFDRIFGHASTRVAILNHARDLHRGTRPFGPLHYTAAAGASLDGWPMRFNAMEVINSGATQTDALQLVHDWMALLNHGYQVTPIGSSDSHDVTRYIVGQGRTYIRAADRDPGAIDVDEAVRSLVTGHALVSYGLVADLAVDGDHGPGDLVRAGGAPLDVRLRVLGPHWVTARRVLLYANGQIVREATIDGNAAGLAPGVKWQATWSLPRPAHDVHLVAVALGDGVSGPWWPTGKPYQPTSPDWEPYTLGVSGAVWVDGDGDGRRSSARDYAWQIHAKAGASLDSVVKALHAYDAAVAVQAAHLYREAGGALDGEAFTAAMATGPQSVRSGFRAYLDAWRENESARAAPAR